MALVVKNPPASVQAGHTRHAGSIPASGRSSGGGNGTPLQYSCMENSMGREVQWATVHGATKSRTRLGTIYLFSIIIRQCHDKM